MKKILETLDKYLIFGLVFLYPLFLFPTFLNPFETGKLLLLVVFLLVISLIKVVRFVINKNLNLKTSKLDLIVLGFILSCLLGTLLLTPNKMDALLLPGTTSFSICGLILYFFINQFSNSDKKVLSIFLALSAFIFGLVYILSFTGIIRPNFDLFGNSINSFFFLTTALVIFLVNILNEEKIKFKIFFGIISFVTFVSLSTVFYILLPQKDTKINLPKLQTTWSVSVDALKQNPLLGVGPGNFIYSFSKFRPLTNNGEANWNIKYLVGSNTVLTIMSEVGLIGLTFFILMFVTSFIKNKENNFKFAVLVIFILSFLYPFSPSFLPILFLVLALNNNSKEYNKIFNSKLLTIMLATLIIGMVTIVSYFSYIGFKAEYLFTTGLRFVSKNDGIKAYETVNKSIATNPYVDRYHLAASEINIALAESLSKKEGLTEDDKKTISELIQQSIREAKAAIVLNKTKSSSWQNLGNIYIKISPFAQNAGDFAIQSYNQAIALDPTDPNLRIKLGGVLYASQRYQEAIKVFELAVLAKPDFANSHYNLAMAYKANKEIKMAKEQIEIVLKLLNPNSNDYQIAKQELDSLNSQKTEEEIKKEGETLTNPTEVVEELEPQIDLPQDLPAI